ncbi:hypothetical protein [Paludisphaera borealis]|uniref:Uncharacterized protein n=1 Tax=Paludisphaera borealis TaxID=1387353 RepID=A0A1U7CX30_9BACT|nr:hypothetical protein [Paludisphaera borealis]APW63510.1 hypothetical protein BSF38_05082 [Paludisphaera borealis]
MSTVNRNAADWFKKTSTYHALGETQRQCVDDFVRGAGAIKMCFDDPPDLLIESASARDIRISLLLCAEPYRGNSDIVRIDVHCDHKRAPEVKAAFEAFGPLGFYDHARNVDEHKFSTMTAIYDRSQKLISTILKLPKR